MTEQYDTAYNDGIRHGRQLEHQEARAKVAKEIERLQSSLTQSQQELERVRGELREAK